MQVAEVTMQHEQLQYDEYLSLFEKDMEQAQATGNEIQLAKLKLNLARMQRIGKKFQPSEPLSEQIRKIDRNLQWIIVVEPWCGDGSETIPMLNNIAALNPRIELKIVLRDRTLQADIPIPQLICMDVESGKRLFTWGPRPQDIQDKFLTFKAENPEMDKESIYTNLHKWYAADKGSSLEDDLLGVVSRKSRVESHKS